MPFSRSRSLLAVSVLTTVVLLAGCADELPPSGDNEPLPPPTSAPEQPDLSIPEGAQLVVRDAARPGEPARPRQAGAASLALSVASLDEGTVTTAKGPDGGTAFDFPDFTDSGTAYPRAVVIARNVDDQRDVLSPDLGKVVFGADLRLDDTSVGRSEDNGNNIVQRGLSSDPVMFKLDLDGNLRPGCTVHGRSGKLMVYAADAVETDRWYRIRCAYADGQLFIYVGEYLPSGDLTTTGRSAEGKVGAIAFPESRIPVSVGGKVARDGSVISSATDQFNGLIGSAFVAIG